MPDRFDDDHGWAGCRPDIDLDWRDLHEPEELCATDPARFVGYYVFVQNRLDNLTRRRMDRSIGRPSQVTLDEMNALQDWLLEAAELLPEWADWILMVVRPFGYNL